MRTSPKPACLPVTLLCLLLALLSVPLGAPPARGQTPDEPFVVEAYPEEVQARLEAVERSFSESISGPGEPGAVAGAGESFTPQYFLYWTRRWTPGQVLKVAFNGGSTGLREKIEKAAVGWSQYCNITFSFKEGNVYREWTPGDSTYKADIRISFDKKGYWSNVGRDSINPSVAPAGEASMNFHGFTLGLPKSYATTVKHEFGHALGFEHEHQNPLNGCDHDFRWENDPGYIPTQDSGHQYITDEHGKQPGVYTVLGGKPNEWSKKQVDDNLREMPESHAFKVGPFDVHSIMKYGFPAWMFVKGKESHCYSDENLDISPDDQKGAALLYPKATNEVNDVLQGQRKALDTLSKVQGLQKELKQQYKLQLDQLK